MRFAKYIPVWLLLVLLVTGYSSCKKYLDIVPDNVGTLDYAFRNKNEAENYLLPATLPCNDNTM